jgi:hypothetical protein
MDTIGVLRRIYEEGNNWREKEKLVKEWRGCSDMSVKGRENHG